MPPSNLTAEWCQHCNNTVAVSGSEWPNPITRPFDTDTDTDTDPDPDLASPRTFSDGLKLGPETYTYTAKRYPYTYTMMRRVRVRVRVRGTLYEKARLAETGYLQNPPPKSRRQSIGSIHPNRQV